MTRYFNTAGPVVAADHYQVPPLQRLDLAELLTLIRQKKYFVLHAPRQSGKTSALLALRDLLNGGTEGAFRCVYCNVEGAGPMGDDVDRAMRTVLDEMAGWAEATLGDRLPDEAWPAILDYVRDLGLVARDRPVRLANPIYAEVVRTEAAEWCEAER